ncbi:MAG TPA: patatin-like protein, partial [Verrucomicrobiae bacterium]
EPASLLNSQRMYCLLFDALQGMTETRDGLGQRFPEAVYADRLDLYVTTTDLNGLPLPIQLTDNVIWERNFRNVFHFVYEPGAACKNDLDPNNIPFLAFAGRATSSFPFAFEPAQWEQMEKLAVEHYGHDPKTSDRWQKFYPQYLQPKDQLVFPQRSFGDGGYLYNKPFCHATKALSHRPACRPVSRKLLYVEPAPDHPENEAAAKKVPDVAENIFKALMELPLQQNIRSDLEELRERNRFLERVNELSDNLERDIWEALQLETGDEKVSMVSHSETDWVKLDLAQLVLKYQVGYVAYHRLKIMNATDDLAELVADIFGVEHDSDRFQCIRQLLNCWRDENYVVYHRENAGREGPRPTQNQYLMDFGVSYRLRRLEFLLDKLTDLTVLTKDPDLVTPGDRAVAETTLKLCGVELPEDLSAWPAALQAAREAVAQSRDHLKQLTDRLADFLGSLPRARVIVSKISLTAKLRELLEQGHNLKSLESIKEFYQADQNSDFREASSELLAFVRKCLARYFLRSRRRMDKYFTGNLDMGAGAQRAVAKCLQHYYLNFDDFDYAIFPAKFGVDREESRPVEIFRVSPDDCTSLFDPKTCRVRKLGGHSVFNFGGFLEREWRRNDIMWGRLDGVERLIRALTFDSKMDEKVKLQLIHEAQAGIVAEELRAPDLIDPQRFMVEAFMRPEGSPNALPALRSFAERICAATSDPLVHKVLNMDTLQPAYRQALQQDALPKPETALRHSSRGVVITGKILQALSRKYFSQGQAVAGWVTWSGYAFWALVELAVPGSLWNRAAAYWIRLFFLIALAFVILGLGLSTMPVTIFGLKLLVAAVLVERILAILNNTMRRRSNRWLTAVRMLGGLAVVFLILLVLLLVTLELRHLPADAVAICRWLGDGLGRGRHWLCD